MKRTGRILLVFLMILPAIAFAHLFIFTQESRCILIRFSNFKKSGNIYYKDISAGELLNLERIKNEAEKKNSLFWKDNLMLDYKIIFCNSEKDFNKYAPAGAPAATYMKMGAYIVIKNESLDENIISHEISHTILYRNIGWFKRTFKIPTWFDEGLAMQVDDRNYYSIDTFLTKKNAGLKMPDFTKLESAHEFFSGDNETVLLNYAASKYIVFEWLKAHSLAEFIININMGASFNEAYHGNN